MSSSELEKDFQEAKSLYLKVLNASPEEGNALMSDYEYYSKLLEMKMIDFFVEADLPDSKFNIDLLKKHFLQDASLKAFLDQARILKG